MAGRCTTRACKLREENRALVERYMGSTFLHHPVVIVLFSMSGCDACKEFLPRFKISARKSRLPVLFSDVWEASALADHFEVDATPFTIALNKDGKVLAKIKGAGDASELAAFFGKARG